MMEGSAEESKVTPQEGSKKRPKGGLITMPFIIANEAFERVASYGLLPNMIRYLMVNYNLGFAKGTNLLFFWSAATNFMPLIGAFVSDTYLGRFLTIGLGSISCLLGMILLWLTAMIPEATPSPCDPAASQSCGSPTGSQMTLLICSFALMAIGAGGIRPCSIAFGADQLDRRDNPRNEAILESFFSWYYASVATAILIAFTGIVYIQDHLGWRVGFGVPVILMFFSAFLFYMASPLYIKLKASQSMFTGFVQVLVVAYKNRKLALPPHNSDGWYHHNKDSKLIAPTDRLRFFNRACIIRNPDQDIKEDGSASNPWRLCTVEQVEELKALVKVSPLWFSGTVMSITISQNTFPLLQASSMDRHIGKSFEIPAGSFGMFSILTITVWLIFYDRALLPLASKIRGKPVRLGVKMRMGIGVFLSIVSMSVTAIVENIRRRRAISEGLLDNGSSVVSMSALWLIPQHCLVGLSEAFNAIGQTEFYYYEFPRSMSSIAASLVGVGTAVASLLASVILSTVDDITSKKGKDSWVSSNVNKGHYDYYYWVLAGICAANLLYFLVCSWAYGACAEEGFTKVRDERMGMKEDGEELANLVGNVNRVKGEEGDGFKEEKISKIRELIA